MSRPYIHLRKDLRICLPEPSWPLGVRLATFEEGRHPTLAHNLLVQAYRHGGGNVGPFDEWWRALREDAEYDSSVFFLALDRCGAVVGLAQCWTSSFLKDLAVSEQWRRKGVGEALLLHAFKTFQERGAGHFDLKVEVGNPSKAECLYVRLGMKVAA